MGNPTVKKSVSDFEQYALPNLITSIPGILFSNKKKKVQKAPNNLKTGREVKSSLSVPLEVVLLVYDKYKKCVIFATLLLLLLTKNENNYFT